MARAPSFKKISFRTTKTEEAFLESLNQTSYHAANTTEFMHKLLKYFMSAGTATSGLTGSFQASGVIDKNDAMTEAGILQEISRLASATDPLEVAGCIKRIEELEAAQKGKQDVITAQRYDPNEPDRTAQRRDPNEQVRTMADCTRLWAEFVDNCARIRRGNYSH